MFRVMLLGSLSAAEATALLTPLGVPQALAPPIVAFAAGHPLALILAAGAALSQSSDSDRPLENVIPQLAKRYLGEVDNAEARNALRASSIARRINVSLLRAL
jgi:hypothetical protein